MLEYFPSNYHEPYFRTYVREDFPSIASGHGLRHRNDKAAFLSKVMVFDKQTHNGQAEQPGARGYRKARAVDAARIIADD